MLTDPEPPTPSKSNAAGLLETIIIGEQYHLKSCASLIKEIDSDTDYPDDYVVPETQHFE